MDQSGDASSSEQQELDGRECPQCTSDNDLIIEQDETYCPDCGFVVADEVVETGLTQLGEGYTEELQTAESPFTRHGSRGTKISSHDIDDNLSERQKERVTRLELWQKRLDDRGEESKEQAFNEISRMRSALGLDKQTSTQAAILYVHGQEQKVQMRRSIEAVATAALYLAAQNANAPVTVEDLERVSRVEATPIMRASQALQKTLGTHISHVPSQKFVSQFASNLGVSMAAQNKAIDWIEQAEANLSGCEPPNIAAAALYAASLTDPKSNLSLEDVVAETPISKRRLSVLYTELYQAGD